MLLSNQYLSRARIVWSERATRLPFAVTCCTRPAGRDFFQGPLRHQTTIDPSFASDTILESLRIWLPHGVALVIIDDISGAEPDCRELTKGAKVVAQTYRTAAVALQSGYPRAPSVRSAKLEDLREYSATADLIDAIMTLHRDEMHDPESLRPGEAHLEIINQRYGPPRRVTLGFQGHYPCFVDMSLRSAPGLACLIRCMFAVNSRTHFAHVRRGSGDDHGGASHWRVRLPPLEAAGRRGLGGQ